VIENALSIDQGKIHCSKPGRNFDLILASSNSENQMLLSNLVIGGRKYNCNSYLKDLLIWVSDSPIDWKLYTHKFNDFTRENYDELSADAPHKPLKFITTDSSSCVHFVNFEPPIAAKYIHFKFIRPHPLPASAPPRQENERNIDLEFIGLWGFADGLPAKRVAMNAKTLYTTVGGQVDDSEEWLHPAVNKHETNIHNNICIKTTEYVNAIKEVQDNQPIPAFAQELGVTSAGIEEVLQKLDLMDEESQKNANQGRLLLNTIPIIHLFRLCCGYPLVGIFLSSSFVSSRLLFRRHHNFPSLLLIFLCLEPLRLCLSALLQIKNTVGLSFTVSTHPVELQCKNLCLEQQKNLLSITPQKIVPNIAQLFVLLTRDHPKEVHSL